jgi:hypothetical protein
MISLAKITVALAANFGFILATLSAQTTDYSFKVLARTGESIDGNTLTDLLDPPVLNERGEVIFSASFSSGEGIFTPDKLLVKSDDTVDGKTLAYARYPSLNNHGTIAFLAGFPTGSGIFAQSKLRVQTGDVVGGQAINTFYAGTSLNDRGEVAFEALVGTPYPIGTAVFSMCPHGHARLIAKAGDTIAGELVNDLSVPVVNNQGTVSFRAGFQNFADPNDTGIVTTQSHGPKSTTLLKKTGDSVSGKLITVFDSPSGITRQGSVIALANYNGGSGIFALAPRVPDNPFEQGERPINRRHSHLLVKAGDTIGGATITQFGQAGVSKRGKTAFYATYAGGAGIFTPVSVVIKTGDPIGLDRLKSILFNTAAINSRGAVVFTGQLDDNSKVIVMAEPHEEFSLQDGARRSTDQLH